MSELSKIFAVAKAFVEEEFSEDLKWSRDMVNKQTLDQITRQGFYREYAFVVYCSGFRYEVVNKNWDKLLEAYRYFDPNLVEEKSGDVYSDAIKIIAHEGKVKAIIETATYLNSCDFALFKDLIRRDIDILSRRLSYIGNITKYHLARNLGFDVVKPDVHIARLARYFNLSPLDMCKYLSEEFVLSVHEVDTILWRTFEQKRIYFSDGRIVF